MHLFKGDVLQEYNTFPQRDKGIFFKERNKTFINIFQLNITPFLSFILVQFSHWSVSFFVHVAVTLLGKSSDGMSLLKRKQN